MSLIKTKSWEKFAQSFMRNNEKAAPIVNFSQVLQEAIEIEQHPLTYKSIYLLLFLFDIYDVKVS